MKWFWKSVFLLAALLLILMGAYVGGESWARHTRTREFDRLVRERQVMQETLKNQAQATQATVPDEPSQP